MEIIKSGDEVSVAFYGDDLNLVRELKPSRFREELYYKEKRNKKVEIFFFITYGELTIFKMKVDEISDKSFQIMKKRINKIIEKNYKKLNKYVDNKFIKYERLLFNIILKKKLKKMKKLKLSQLD